MSEIPLQNFLVEWRKDCRESDHTTEDFRAVIFLSLLLWLIIGAIVWSIW